LDLLEQVSNKHTEVLNLLSMGYQNMTARFEALERTMKARGLVDDASIEQELTALQAELKAKREAVKALQAEKVSPAAPPKTVKPYEYGES
jgi:predicted O-linked N-acetylglucosamine transferase (SPINDLY family)